MSDLPNGWDQLRVGDYFRSHSGGTPNRATAEFWGGDIHWVSSGDVKNTRISSASEQITVKGLDNSSAKICPVGSVIVVVRSGILKHTLPVAVVDAPLSINQDIKCFDSGDPSLNEWFALSLRTHARDLLAHNREGTTVQSVTSDTLNDHAVRLPPLNEQRRIVEKLEKLLGRVEAVQERLDKIPAILKRFRQSVLAAACSGKLTADRRKQQSTDLAQGWGEVLLNSVVTVKAGEAFKKAEYSSDGARLLQIANVSFGKIIWEQQNFLPLRYSESHPDLVLADEDILIALNRPLLNWRIKVAKLSKADLPAILYQRVGKFHILEEGTLNRSYLYQFLQSPGFIIQLSEKLRGTDQPYVNPPEMLEISIPLPPLEEQQEIVRRVEELFKFADALEERYKKARAHTDKLTQSVLAKAFRGELVPQDPNDEPASKLLERIKANTIGQ